MALWPVARYFRVAYPDRTGLVLDAPAPAETEGDTMGIDAKGWVLLVVGAAAGVGLTLLSAAVRDAVLDAVDAVLDWWEDLVYRVKRFLVTCGLLLLGGLAGWAVIALVLPRLAAK
jgi:hypothetical protein